MEQRTNPYYVLVTSLLGFLATLGCNPSNTSNVPPQGTAPASRIQPNAIVNLTELYVNDKRSEYKNATLNVGGLELQFDHRCTMFGWYEFSCEFPKDMENEIIANALQSAWDTQRIEGLPGVSVSDTALLCLQETARTSLSSKKSVECEQFDLSVNAFRAIDGSRNEVWLRFERKKEAQTK